MVGNSPAPPSPSKVPRAHGSATMPAPMAPLTSMNTDPRSDPVPSGEKVRAYLRMERQIARSVWNLEGDFREVEV